MYRLPILFYFVCVRHSGNVHGLTCVGCPTPGNIDDAPNAEELKEMAKIKAQVLMKTQMNLLDDDQDPCGLELESIENFRTQVVAGTIFKFDAKFKWNQDCPNDLAGQVIDCQGFNVFQALPVYCDKSTNCLEVIREEEIKCT